MLISPQYEMRVCVPAPRADSKALTWLTIQVPCLTHMSWQDCTNKEFELDSLQPSIHFLEYVDMIHIWDQIVGPGELNPYIAHVFLEWNSMTLKEISSY